MTLLRAHQQMLRHTANRRQRKNFILRCTDRKHHGVAAALRVLERENELVVGTQRETIGGLALRSLLGSLLLRALFRLRSLLTLYRGVLGHALLLLVLC